MRKSFFKEGDIVQNGTIVAVITKIEDGKATLGKNYEVALEKLSHVEINSVSDHGIILDCNIPTRASVIAPGESIPIRRDIPYLEGVVEGKPIKSIIEENGFVLVAELQDWLSQNAPDYYLRTRIGL